MEPTFDSDYLIRLRDHDPQTEAHFVSHFSSLIRTRLLRGTPFGGISDEVVQEVLVRVLNAVYENRVAEPDALRALVYDVCERVLSEFSEELAPERDTTTNPSDQSKIRWGVNTFTIAFSPDLSPNQIRGTLDALADYYRACGGVGLRIQFEMEEARILELAHV